MIVKVEHRAVEHTPTYLEHFDQVVAFYVTEHESLCEAHV